MLCEFEVGDRVRSLRDFVKVPKGTEGVVIEDYGSGITVAWDLPDHPLPDLPEEEIAAMFAVNHRCPIRDGFDKMTELHFLEII